MTYHKDITGLLVIDPYNDFISEGGKVWDRLKGIADRLGALFLLLIAVVAALAYSIGGSGNHMLTSGPNDFVQASC
jgi:ureidoacrylate peracid hydrolase